MTTQAPDAPRLAPEDRDIVANLRQGADDLHPFFVGDTDKVEADCALPAYLNDAADEIERLRAMLAAAPAVQPAAGREGIANHDCLAKRRPGEPMFILLGRDPDAHNIVRLWAERRLAAGGDPEHCQMGLDTAERMAAYAADPANRPASAPDASDYPAISTPAQASESGGEERKAADAALADLALNLASDLSSGHFGMPDAIQMIEALATRLAALSAPQAAPGEGEQS